MHQNLVGFNMLRKLRPLLGQLIREFNWGPSQPSGGDQHCMYIVGGYLGYQWADFHCGFEMTFLCEYKVNDHEAWRRRRQMKNSAEFNDESSTQYYDRKSNKDKSSLDSKLNQRINYTLTNWLHTNQYVDIDTTSTKSIREDLNSKFNGEHFIIRNNHEINNYLLKEKNQEKSVIITTKRPNKHSVIISTHHKNKRPPFGGTQTQQHMLSHISSSLSPISSNALTNSFIPEIMGGDVKVEQTHDVPTTTTTISTTTTTNTQTYSTSKPDNNAWSIFEFLKNIIVKFG